MNGWEVEVPQQYHFFPKAEVVNEGAQGIIILPGYGWWAVDYYNINVKKGQMYGECIGRECGI